MSDSKRGCGVQVLSVEEDGTYRSDDGALRRVTEQGAARALPVAVVSVAGATRGGKSFLLDFFLRYLYASDAARRSGEWLGADTEPLTGFSWRGGCDRDTRGILLWSEPIVVSLGPEDNNEKVAVVLMDTQGTFDSCSTVRDSSTIFAMSTLLSSVQIYNLTQNIKEDDLQYLQLFTEYGRLAREGESGSPFEVLQFLVRDWSYAYEHPVGASGGQQLLDKRLEIHSEQASELKEIREHISSAFEELRCFLLPHPGLTVSTSAQFKGCLADISPEFKNALLELVPSLLGPGKIKPKTINGQTITVQDLAEYFNTYIDIFNSDTLPTPTTVMQATSQASLEAALNASRALYNARMGRSGRVCGRRQVVRTHVAALEAARACFTARKTFTAPARTAARIDALMQELNAMLANYIAINNGRILEAVASCKASYEAAMEEVACLSSDELRANHRAAIAVALTQYDNIRSGDEEFDEHTEEESEEDEDRRKLEKELEDLLPLFHEKNEERIVRAFEAGRSAYDARLRVGLAESACLAPCALAELHAETRADVRAAFLQAWMTEGPTTTAHELNLLQELDEKYSTFETVNITNNNEAVLQALDFYHQRMSEVFVGTICLHSRDLALEHERAEDAARENFLEKRGHSGQDTGDFFVSNLMKRMQFRCLHFGNRNEERNKDAIEYAHSYYVRHISPARDGPEGLMGVFGAVNFDVIRRHPIVKGEALEKFQQRRRPGSRYIQDEHLDALLEKINTSYMWLIAKLCASIGATGVTMALSTALLFFRR